MSCTSVRAHEVTDEPVGNIGLIAKLLRDRQWWLGSLVAAGGFAGRGAGPGFGAAGAGVAGQFVAVRAADQRAALPPDDEPLGVGLGGIAGAAVAVVVTVGDPQAG